jgi:hypothetical protein
VRTLSACVLCILILQDFIKIANKKDTHAPRYGVLESKALDAAAVEAISALPSKTELYRRIAVGVKAVPQKLARGINVSATCYSTQLSVIASLLHASYLIAASIGSYITGLPEYRHSVVLAAGSELA